MTSTEQDETVSVPTQSVHMPMNMDPETATYVAMLEGTIAALVISDCKSRTLLELLTGDGWEAARVDFKGQTLIALAVSALVKQTGMDRVRAQVLVSKRWQERNHPADYIVPQAVSPDTYLATATAKTATSSQLAAEPVDVSARVKDWRARQLAAAENVDPEATVSAPNESVSDSTAKTESVGLSDEARNAFFDSDGPKISKTNVPKK